jgi:hypothetical protein
VNSSRINNPFGELQYTNVSIFRLVETGDNYCQFPKVLEEQRLHEATMVYPKVAGLAAWSENCKWHRSLSLGAVVSLFCESV